MGTENQPGLIPILFLAFAVCVLAASAHADDQPATDMPVAALEQALDGTDLKPLFSLINVPRLTERAGLDHNASDAIERLRDRLGEQQISTHRLYTTDQSDLVLRLDLTPRGLNWLELHWHDASAQQPLDDWYDAALGIWLSELVAGIALLAESRAGRSFLETLDESPRRAWGNLDRREQRSNPAAARLLLAACNASSCYSLALKALQQFPQETPALWQLDAAALDNDREGFQQTLDQLKVAYAPDPGFAWLAGAEALRYGSCEEVIDDINQAVGNWPDYQPLYPVLTQCLVSDGNYAMALNFFAIMEDRFGLLFDWPALAGHPVYRKLLASDSFPDWCAKRSGCELPAE